MKALLAGIVLMSSLCTCFSGELKSESDTSTKSSPAKSQIYAIYLMDGKASYILADVETCDFHGIKSLKGKHVDMTWVKNRIIYVPTDKISAIIEYSSFEEYKTVMDNFQKERFK